MDIKTLYHGSCWERHDGLLFPGYYMSGQLRCWDQTESNKFLYTCPDKDEAIRQAIYGLCEKNFKVVHVKAKDKRIKIEAHDVILPSDILSETVYLYTIPVLEKDDWVLVGNKHNGMDNEYKTPASVKYSSREDIKLQAFLRGYTFETKLVK